MSERDDPGARSGRQPAEGVRIIKAEEAQAALDAGEAAGRRPDDQLRFGDVPPAPTGPRPAHRFPLPDSVDPAEAVELPPLAPPRLSPSAAGTRQPPPPTPVPSTGPTGIGARHEEPSRLEPQTATGGDHDVEPDAPPWAAAPGSGSAGSDRTTELAPEIPDEGITVSGAAEMPHWSDPPTGEVPRLRFDDEFDPDVNQDDLAAWRALGARGVRWRDDDGWDEVDELSDLAPEENPEGALDQNRAAHSDLYSFDEDFERVTGRTDVQPVVDLTSVAEIDDSRDEDWARIENGDPRPTGRAAHSARGGRPWDRGRGGYDRLGRRGRRSGAGSGVGSAAAGAAGAAAGGVAGAAVAGAATAGAAAPGSAPSAGPTAPTAAVSGSAGLAAGGSGDDTGAWLAAESPASPRSGGATADRDADRPVVSERSGPGPTRRPPAGGGDLNSRVAIGVGLLIVLAIFYVIGTRLLVVLSAVVVVAAAAEAYHMTRAPGFRPATFLGLVATLGCVFGAYWKGIGAIPVVTVLLFVGTMLWYVLGVVEARPLANVAVTVMVFVWVSVLGSFSAVLLQERNGKGLFLGAIVVAVAADVCAFVVGRWIGSRPLAPSISPHKTIEGFIGGVIGAIIVGAIVGKTVHPWSGMRYGFILGLVVGLISPAGDLFESMLKRDLGIKDSGSLLGGHGGLLDRFDGILLALPAAYFVATIANIH